MEKDNNMIFNFTDGNKRTAHCDIEKIGNVIIMTELADNTGASVTNSFEYIAEQYTEQEGLSVEELTFIERYDKRSYANARAYNDSIPNYALVTFIGNAGRLKPRWKHLTKEQFNDFIKK